MRAAQLILHDNKETALPVLLDASELADAAWLAGSLYLTMGRAAEAVPPLEAAYARADELGATLQILGITCRFTIDITPEFQLVLPPGHQGVTLALVEALQASNDPVRALRLLQHERQHHPDDPLLALSYAELAWDTWKHEERALEAVVQITDGFENESAVHAAILLYRSRAMRELNQLQSARAIILSATRRTKDRPKDLLHALRYERALVHEALGESTAAKKELARIHAENSQYLDVAARLSV